MTATSPPGSGPIARSDLRSVAVPSEHGGWGLTAEPVLLGVLVAPSTAGLCVGLAAVLAFMARTPLKVLLVDAYRDRRSRRAGLARTVLAVELTVIALLAVTTSLTATDTGWWWPVAVAAPLIVVELWFDMRSRSRRLLPELAGTVGIASVAAAVALAGGSTRAVALGLWLVLAGRAVTSIPYVRAQIARLHGHPTAGDGGRVTDTVAVVLAAAALAVDQSLLAGTVGVVVVVGLQRWWARGDVPAAKVLGLRQMGLGFGLVLVTALGVYVL